ncbi:MAG: NADP-dependent isocitrate dehydrogenase [Pseudomonadota bacterium]
MNAPIKNEEFQHAEASIVDNAVPVTVAFGDGIGPEIMEASLKVLVAAEPKLVVERVDVGEAVYLAGNTSGIEETVWDSIRRTRTFYKAPITTPQGSGYKSLNVTIRKSLGLFANVRPSVSYAPFVATEHPNMDVVVVRENEEDLYAGIEHRQTQEVYQCLKLVSRPGTERIIRYAFEYARANGRKKVSCFSKDNIMKLTDGLFHKVFDEIAPEYPDIETDHWIIDIGAARLAARPDQFDVIVTSNLYGDILSDIATEVSGSVGLGPSSNIGSECAMFEAIHGSAPDIAGQGVANPSGLLLAGVMMLIHLGKSDAAERVHNAWLATMEAGVHTPDVYRDGLSTRKVSTMAFADAVISRLGDTPTSLTPVSYAGAPSPTIPAPQRPAPQKKTHVGIDVFLESDLSPDALASGLQTASQGLGLDLTMISNRGVKVWPKGLSETFCTDHWRCRFEAGAGGADTHAASLKLLTALAEAGFPFVKTEGLYGFDGERGFSLSQGQ